MKKFHFCLSKGWLPGKEQDIIFTLGVFLVDFKAQGRFYSSIMPVWIFSLMFLFSLSPLAQTGGEEERFVQELSNLPSKEAQIQKIQSLRSRVTSQREGRLSRSSSDLNWQFVVEQILFLDLPSEVHTVVLDFVEEFYWNNLALQKGLWHLVDQKSFSPVKKQALELLKKTPIHRDLHSLLMEVVQASDRQIYVRRGALILLGTLPRPPDSFQDVLWRVMQESSHKFVGSETNNLFYLKSAAAGFMYHIKDPDIFINVLQRALVTPNNYVKDMALQSLDQNPPPFENHYNFVELQKILSTSLQKETNRHIHDKVFAILRKATEWASCVEEAMAKVIQGGTHAFPRQRLAIQLLPRMSVPVQVSLVQFILNRGGNEMTNEVLKAFAEVEPTSDSLYAHPPTLKMLIDKVFFTTIKVDLKLKMLYLLFKAHLLSEVNVVTAGFEMHTVQLMKNPETNPYLVEHLIPFIPYFSSLEDQKVAVLAALKNKNSYVNGRMLKVLDRKAHHISASVFNDEDIQKHLVSVAFFEEIYSMQQLAFRALKHVSEPHPDVVRVLDKAKTSHKDLQKRRTAANIFKQLHLSPPPRGKSCKDTF